MKVVAIISEYNPFHLGHEYQIRKIREEFGQDTAIIAIMSGNFTERGDIAIADKFLRAKCAVLCGVNLVLELPFPYSVSSAELFAKAGVAIADSLGIVDYISFGSESGDIESLTKIATNMQSEKYQQELSSFITDKDNSAIGYPKACECVYKHVFSLDISDVFTSNNILALEYIKALNALNSKIMPHTIKRSGTSYSCEKVESGDLPSATAVREIMRQNFDSAREYIPNSAFSQLKAAYHNAEFPTSEEALNAAVISNFRLNLPKVITDIHDTEGGLYNRLLDASYDADSISSLIALTETKKYTKARIKRSIWYSFFGVTSSDVKATPEYTQALALDNLGRQLLKGMKKTASVKILTKPTATDDLPISAVRQKRLSDTADSIFQLTKPSSHSGRYSLLQSPFVKATD